MSRTHLASCGLLGMWGRRSGTAYAHTPREAWGLRGEPWFRFRNDECERICREAWAKPDPTSSLFFEATNEKTPDYSWITSDIPEVLKADELIRWEGEAYSFVRLHYFNTQPNLFQLYKNSQSGWYAVGRIFRLTEEGRFVMDAHEESKKSAA